MINWQFQELITHKTSGRYAIFSAEREDYTAWQMVKQNHDATLATVIFPIGNGHYTNHEALMKRFNY